MARLFDDAGTIAPVPVISPFRKARAGEIAEFTGISSPYEPLENPSLIVDTAGRTIGQCVDRIWRAIRATRSEFFSSLSVTASGFVPRPLARGARR